MSVITFSLHYFALECNFILMILYLRHPFDRLLHQKLVLQVRKWKQKILRHKFSQKLAAYPLGLAKNSDFTFFNLEGDGILKHQSFYLYIRFTLENRLPYTKLNLKLICLR